MLVRSLWSTRTVWIGWSLSALCCQRVENSARNMFVPIMLRTSGHSAYSRWRSCFHRKHLWVWVARYPKPGKPLSPMAVQLLTPMARPALVGPLQQGSSRGKTNPFRKKITDSHSANSKFSSFSRISACQMDMGCSSISRAVIMIGLVNLFRFIVTSWGKDLPISLFSQSLKCDHSG